jgi:hypothetical protein
MGDFKSMIQLMNLSEEIKLSFYVYADFIQHIDNKNQMLTRENIEALMKLFDK